MTIERTAARQLKKICHLVIGQPAGSREIESYTCIGELCNAFEVIYPKGHVFHQLSHKGAMDGGTPVLPEQIKKWFPGPGRQWTHQPDPLTEGMVIWTCVAETDIVGCRALQPREIVAEVEVHGG